MTTESTVGFCKEGLKGNPNIDAYFHPDWLVDYQHMNINGTRWELDLRDAEVMYDFTVSGVLECAKVRAREDRTTVEEVLEDWDGWNDAPEAVHDAYMSVLTGERPPDSR